MDTREVNIILRKKARTELTILRKQLLAQSPQIVLDRAYEYATKSDMVSLINETEFTAKQARALLRRPRLLDSLFKEYGNHSSNSMDVLVSFMMDKANEYVASGQNKFDPAKDVR